MTQMNLEKEILIQLKNLLVEQAALRERVDSHLKQTDIDLKELKKESKLVQKHELMYKVSLYIYGILASIISYKLYHKD